LLLAQCLGKNGGSTGQYKATVFYYREFAPIKLLANFR
jgi:hypothetical protein